MQNIDPLSEIRAILHTISTRLDALEQRAAPANDAAAPPFALLCDGRLLRHVRSSIDGDDREHWTGVILTEAEACDLRDLAEAALLAISHR